MEEVDVQVDVMEAKPREMLWDEGHRKLLRAADQTRGRTFQAGTTGYVKAQRQDRA